MPTEPITTEITLLHGNDRIMGTFARWDEAPGSEDNVRLRPVIPTTACEADSEEGYFDALCRIRLQLEPQGLFLDCYGASENVFPSPMIRSMGSGEMAYLLTMGKPALKADLVDIFDSGPGMNPATVAQQEAFYQRWLASLR